METFGKGKSFSRIVKISTSCSFSNFQLKFLNLFSEFSHHIVPSWFLTNTKFEIMKPLSRRRAKLFLTTDFAENVLIIEKFELADQYFHRTEILLFGGVASFIIEDSEGNQLELYRTSYMISSDYK